MKYSILLALIFVLSNIDEIKAQEITIWPGAWGQQYYQDYQRITKTETESLLSTNPDSYNDWKKSKKHMTLAWTSYAVGIGFAIWQLNSLANERYDILPTIGLLGSMGTSIGFILSSNRLKKDAVLNYNEGADVSSIKFGPTYNGIGLVMSF